MRGSAEKWGALFSYVDLERRLPAKHPLRTIRTIVNEALDVQSHDVMAYRYRRQKGTRYGPSSSWERQDPAGRSSRATANASFVRGARATLRAEQEDGEKVAVPPHGR